MKRLPDSELEIMMAIWECPVEVTSEYLMEHLDKTWAKTTVLNFLNRLCERGFLSVHKDGRKNVYQPLVKKDDYLKWESKTFLKKLHHNSVKSLFASLYDGKKLSGEEISELRQWIEGMEE